MSDRTYEDWTVVFKTSTDYEADLVRDRLDDAGLSAIVLTQRDHAFNLNVGDLAPVNVLVPPEHVAQAREILNSSPLTDAELDAAALGADPHSPDAHTPEDEALLDSGIESIRVDVPEEEEGEEARE